MTTKCARGEYGRSLCGLQSRSYAATAKVTCDICRAVLSGDWCAPRYGADGAQLRPAEPRSERLRADGRSSPGGTDYTDAQWDSIASGVRHLVKHIMTGLVEQYQARRGYEMPPQDAIDGFAESVVVYLKVKGRRNVPPEILLVLGIASVVLACHKAPRVTVPPQQESTVVDVPYSEVD